VRFSQHSGNVNFLGKCFLKACQALQGKLHVDSLSAPEASSRFFNIRTLRAVCLKKDV
jgi:hypothetical protein